MKGTAAAVADEALRVRAGAGLFALSDRGVIEVRGGDRERWLNGMVSADVAALRPGPEASGCYATLLTPQGRIVADLHVLAREESYWLELSRPAVSPVVERLSRYVIADDVELSDASSAFVRLALEGPAVPEIMARAAPGLALPAPECACEWELEDHVVSVAAYGVSGMPALQYLIPSGGEAVRRVLSRAGEGLGLVEASPAALEVLRIEAGTPALGPELDEDVLPDEAGLGRAISDTKGCYTGQEIVARLRSQGQVAHRLVGLRFGADAPLPPVDSDVRVGGRVIGEVTSVCQSAQVGAIALGYVRRAHAESGTEVEVAGRPAQVSSLPFVAAKAAG